MSALYLMVSDTLVINLSDKLENSRGELKQAGGKIFILFGERVLELAPDREMLLAVNNLLRQAWNPLLLRA